jgi:hypothetical protein
MVAQAFEVHSMSAQELIDEIVAVAKPFLDLKCAGGKLYLGSMFYLDFGNTFDSISRRGRAIKIGEMTLSVRDVAWSLFDADTPVTDAESVDADMFDKVVCLLRGKRILGLRYRPDFEQLEIAFSAGVYFLVDLTNKWQSDSDVIELAFPDGRRIAISNNGKLIVDTHLDPDRVANWSRCSH